MQSLKIFY